MSNDIHIFEIDKVKFIAGLLWQPLSGASTNERKKETKNLAKELDFDLAVTRNSSTYTVGFAKGKDFKGAVYSAAALVSKSLEIDFQATDFIFVSELPDGKWIYIAQKKSTILGDGDVVFSSEDAARSQLMEHMSLGEWEFLFVPEVWGVNGAIDKKFNELIPRKKGKIKIHPWWRLQPVGSGLSSQFSAHKNKILIGVASFSVLSVGVIFYNQWQQKKEAEEAMRLAYLDQAGKPIPPEHPWKSAPLASDFYLACADAVQKQNLFPGNWSVKTINCIGNVLSVSWVPKTGGWIKHLREIVPNARIARNGSSASVNTSIGELSPGGDEDIESEEERMSKMHEAAQAYGVQFTSSSMERPQLLPGQGNQLPPDWAEIGWQVRGVDFPEAVLAALDGPGFRMTSMSAEISNGKFVWMMEGIQYVKQ